MTVTKGPAGPLLCHAPDNSTGRNFPYLQNPLKVQPLEVVAKSFAARLRARRAMTHALCSCLVRLQKFQLLKSAGVKAQRRRGNLILFKPGRSDLHCRLHTWPQDALPLPCHSHAAVLCGKKEGKWQLLRGAEGTGREQAAHLLTEEPKR